MAASGESRTSTSAVGVSRRTLFKRAVVITAAVATAPLVAACDVLSPHEEDGPEPVSFPRDVRVASGISVLPQSPDDAEGYRTVVLNPAYFGDGEDGGSGPPQSFQIDDQGQVFQIEIPEGSRFIPQDGGSGEVITADPTQLLGAIAVRARDAKGEDHVFRMVTDRQYPDPEIDLHGATLTLDTARLLGAVGFRAQWPESAIPGPEPSTMYM